MLRLAALSVALLALAGGRAPALADGDVPLASDLVGASQQPRRGELWLALGWEKDLSERIRGNSALTPELTWGLTDRLALSWTHSSASIARIGRTGGICLDGCDERPEYAGALLAQLRLVSGTAELALLAGTMVRDPSPWKVAALAGARARWSRGRLGADATAYLQLGLTNTDLGNRHRLVMMVRGWLQPTCRWALGLGSGVEGELAVFADGHHIPLLTAVRARLSSRLVAHASAGFSSLLGPQNTIRTRYAALTLELRY